MSAQAETACHPHPSAGKRPAIHSPSTTTLTSPPLRLPTACLPPALPAPCLPLQAQGVISAPPPCRNTRYFHLCHLTQDHFSPKKKRFPKGRDTQSQKGVGCLRLQVSAAYCSAHLNQPKRGEGSKKCLVPRSRRGMDLTAGLPYKHPSQGPLWDPHTCGVHPSIGSLLPRKADLRCGGPWRRQSQVCLGLCHSCWVLWVLGEQRYPTAGHGWVLAP